MDPRQKVANAIWPWGVETPDQMRLALKESAAIGYKLFESVKQAIYCYDFDVEHFKADCDEFDVHPCSFYFHMSGDWKQDCATLEKELNFVRRIGVDYCALQAAHNPTAKMDLERTKAATEEIREYARIAKASGLTFCLHPHIFTECMYEPEIDYMMQHLTADEISMQPDTAHLLAGGSDPATIIRRYADRVDQMHLKDFDPANAVETRAQEGMSVEVYKCFTELGTGSVDFRTVFDILKAADFNGFLINELDTTHYTNAISSEMNYKFVLENY